jgi:hypothetical protein
VQKLRWPDGRVVMAFRAIPQVPPHTKIGETVQGGRVVHVVQGVGLQTTKKAKYLFLILQYSSEIMQRPN